MNFRTPLGRKIPRALAIAAASAGSIAFNYTLAHAASLGDVFVIDMENRNWTAGTDTTGGAVILGNSAAPYINSLITPNNGSISAQVSYASAYHNALATPSGANPSIHPSEPNYLWQESGTNFGITNDNDPYGSGNNVAAIGSFLAANPSVSGQNLSGLLQAKGVSWKSYQEGIDLTPGSGSVNQPGSNSLTNTVAPQNQWTVPLVSFSGTSSSYTNPYNGSHQYNFAAKHDGSLFFTDTNGGNNLTNSNPETVHYAPLEQLQSDLNNNTAAQYNLITPDQYNDMHTALTGGFTYHSSAFAGGTQSFSGDLAQIAQGDNFLSIVVPQIEASQAYKNNGAIVIWTDETEGTNQNDFNHTLMEIVISPLAKGNAFNSTLNYTHSSDLATLQEIFQSPANTSTGYLNDAANPSTPSSLLPNGSALDLSDMFVSGTIPSTVPEPASLGLIGLGGLSLLARRRKTQVIAR